MSTNLATIDIDVPVEVAYDQWTNLQLFPAFMDDVEEVTRIGPGHHRWLTKIAGVQREFETQVVDHVPAERIVWTSTDGVDHEGEVTFESVADDRTGITVRLDLDPATMVEQIADQFGVVRRHLQASLEEFKLNVEARPTGAHLNASYDPYA